MNPYEGLNLPQLLDLMHGLAMPEPVPWILQTRGWWLVAGWLAVVSGLAVIKIISRRRQNRYRREAIDQLRQIESVAAQDPAAAAVEIALLLKRTALAIYPRQQVAHLYGSDWARFLCETAGNDPGVAGAAVELAGAAYDRNADGGSLIGPARRWIEIHHA